MKKILTLLESHVEKLVLVLCAGALLTVLVLQFALGKPTVQVGTGDVPLENAYQEAERTANERVAAMRNPEPELPDPVELNMVQRFEDATSGPIAPRSTLAAAMGSPLLLGEIADAPIVDAGQVAFALPDVPGPVSPAAAASWVTLDPLMVVADDRWREHVPRSQPFDAVGVSVQGTFDGTALAEAMRTDPDGDGPQQPFRGTWWRSNLHLLSVQLERQRLEGGFWSEPEPVAVMPGAFDLAAALTVEGVPARDRLRETIEYVNRDEDAVLRTPFPTTIAPAGWQWEPPAESIAREQQDEPWSRLQRQRTQKLEDIERIEFQLENLGNDDDDGGRGDPGGGRRPPGRNPPGGGTDPDERRRDQLQQRLEILDEQVVDLEEQMRALGWVSEDEEQRQPDRRRNDRVPLLEDPEIQVWAHDFSAEPGVAYRYRLRVVLNNPAFGQSGIGGDQRDLRERLTMPSAWSDWTAPVDVLTREQVYVVSGSTGLGQAQVGGLRAGVEVYSFYYGSWRKGSEQLTPGDVVRLEIPIRESEQLRLYDEDSLRALAQERGLGGGNWQPPRDPGRDPGGRDPGRDPGGRGDPRGDPPRRPGNDPRTPPTTDPEAGEPYPSVESTPALQAIQIDRAEVLLDVAERVIRGARGRQTLVEVLLADPSRGAIRVRRPDEERSSPQYERIRDAEREAAQNRNAEGGGS